MIVGILLFLIYLRRTCNEKKQVEVDIGIIMLRYDQFVNRYVLDRDTSVDVLFLNTTIDISTGTRAEE